MIREREVGEHPTRRRALLYLARRSGRQHGVQARGAPIIEEYARAVVLDEGENYVSRCGLAGHAIPK